jgi:hypothetical protein
MCRTRHKAEWRSNQQTQHHKVLQVPVRRTLWIGVDPPETRYALSDVDHLQFQDSFCINA